MRQVSLFTAVLAIIGLVAIGCQTEPTNPMGSDDIITQSPGFALPAGAVFQSATLHLYVQSNPGENVNVHRVVGAWDEATVTWSNFGGNYVQTPVNSFAVSDTNAWLQVDVGPLVSGWLNGDFENNGLLLDQGAKVFPRTVFSSKENAGQEPFVTICYDNNGVVTCDTVADVGDSYIWELGPGINFGDDFSLYSGWQMLSDLEHQALLQFDIAPQPVELSSVGDLVWLDVNKDGIQGADESGAEGVLVYLYDCTDQLVDSQFTDVNGNYLFEQLSPGDYYLKVVLPTDHELSPVGAGTDNLADSDFDPLSNSTVCTTLDPGEADLGFDAGISPITVDDDPGDDGGTGDVGCTAGKGFWYNHCGFGPQPDLASDLLPLTLGDGSGKSVVVDNNQVVRDVLSRQVYGSPKSGINKLYSHLLTCKLNVANGADDADIADVVSDCDAFLAAHDHNDWDSLNKEDRQRVRYWAAQLASYFDGEIGPGECTDDDWGDVLDSAGKTNSGNAGKGRRP